MEISHKIEITFKFNDNGNFIHSFKNDGLGELEEEYIIKTPQALVIRQ